MEVKGPGEGEGQALPLWGHGHDCKKSTRSAEGWGAEGASIAGEDQTLKKEGSTWKLVPQCALGKNKCENELESAMMCRMCVGKGIGRGEGRCEGEQLRAVKKEATFS